MIQVISLLVENKPGALMRITGVLTARGYNIESLTVARTLDPELSHMTIAVDVDPVLRSQVIKQMIKLINVLQASDLTESRAVIRETFGSLVSATFRLSILNPRPLNRPEILERTPKRLFTSTDIVCCMRVNGC